MLKIITAKTHEEIEVAKILFAEFDLFLKKQFAEYMKFQWAIKHWQNLGEEVKSLPGKYAEPHGCILIANYKNKPAGCVGLLTEDNDVSIMKRLYVKPEFRSLGIGKSLVETIIEHSRRRRCKIMRLNTNLLLKTAINLYKSLGFKEIKHNRKIPDEIKDLIIDMELKLE